MRIALFHNTPSGGAKRSIYEWTRRLAGEHTIDVYTLSSADHAFCDLRPLVRQHSEYPVHRRVLFDSPLGRLNQLQRWRDLGDLDRLSRSMAEAIDSQEYDLLFANTCAFTFVPPVLRHVRLRSAYYLHEPFGRSFVRDYRRPYLNGRGWRQQLDKYDPFIRLYQNRLDALQHASTQAVGWLLANSRFTAERMPPAARAKTRLSPYGVDADCFRPNPKIRKENYVVSVGEMSPRKGFDFVIESLGQIPDKLRPPLKLACNRIEDQELKYIRALADRCGVELQVLTQLDASALRRLYNAALVCVYGPYLEPFGLVPLEAMACGTPVVGVREGGVPESIVHEATGLLTSRDAGLFAEAVVRLLRDPQLATRMGQNGRDHVLQSWTWEASTQILESHLVQCASSG
jgi:glycosyltransferase involved in cell wall biosynthesis